MVEGSFVRPDCTMSFEDTPSAAENPAPGPISQENCKKKIAEPAGGERRKNLVKSKKEAFTARRLP